MYRNLIISNLLLLTLIAGHASAQDDDRSDIPNPAGAPVQVLKGVVRSAGTGSTLTGATVTIAGSRLGAVTRSDGSFSIENVPVGRHMVSVRSLGYEPATVQVLLTSGRQGVIEVELNESVIKGAEVTVAGDAFKPIDETALVSVNSFTIEEVQRYAGGFDDPGRIALNFAGVLATDDQNNEIVIRGGAPNEVLWRLDGIDIPNPNHFGSQGASGGPINAINSNLLANSDFFTGAFPPEYGGKLSGVFDLRTRKGNQDRYEFVAQAGFNGMEGMVEGPIPGVEKGSFIASYRKSTLEVFDLLGISLDIGDVIPKYEDATLKLDLPLGASDALSVTALGGISNAEDKMPEQFRTGYQMHTEGTDIGAAGIVWTRFISEDLVGRFTINTQYNRYRESRDSLTAGANGELADRTTTWKRNSAEGSHGARYSLTYAPDASHLISAGIEGRLVYYDLYDRHPLRPIETDPNNVEASGEAGAGSGFVSWNWRPTEELAITSGVHAQYFGLNGSSSIEPRVAASWSFTEGQSINAGFGVHRQLQPLIVYFNNAANRDLDFTQSIHYVLGYGNRLASDLMGKVELYYKDISNAPVARDLPTSFSMLNVGPDYEATSIRFPLKNEGKGRTYGVDLSLVKHFTNGYYVNVTGSLFRQQYTGSDDVWRYGVFDNRYVMNILAGYEWKVSSRFTMEFGGRFTIAGGRRYHPINIDSSRHYRTTYVDGSRAYAEHLPDYMRLDTRIDFRNNFDGWTFISYVSILNTLDRENIFSYYYDRFTDRIESTTQFGMIPVGGIRVEF